MSDLILPRRAFVGGTLAATASLLLRRPAWLPAHGAPAIITSERLRPLIPNGVQIGDPRADRAMFWSRADRPAVLSLEWSASERFTNVRRLRSAPARENDAFTTHLDVTDLPAGQTIFYRAAYESLEAPGAMSEPVTGKFRTAPRAADRALRVAWSGDMVGQGWGIDEARGGLRMYDAIMRAEPDVFIHSGDNVYADGPLQPVVTLDDGTIWRNVMTDAKSKVAETLDEYRGQYAYNLLDANAQRFGRHVPMIAQWDDHEVVNNWFHDLTLHADDRYTEKSVRVLAERAKQALFEFLPIRRNEADSSRLYRSFSYGPLLDIFVVDMRSYRGANSANLQPAVSPDTALLGGAQLAWLERSLRESTAVWKVIASDMPIGLVVADGVRGGEPQFEAVANADAGAPLGRELEIARLLRALRDARVHNVVWLTADVHYAAAHHYSPERGTFTEFDSFWEFVAGPMHAGTFGPNALDMTFGPDVRFVSAAPKPNRPPSDNLQFYGTIDIDPDSRTLTASLWDVTGRRLWNIELPPQAS